MPDWITVLCERLERSGVDTEVHRDVIEEVSHELEDVYRDALAAGATPEQAEETALRDLGDVTAMLQSLRARNRRPAKPATSDASRPQNRVRTLVEDLVQDFRFGIRVMARKPGFTTLAIVTLALGIGASTSMFSAVNGVLLKPLPYPEPDRLMTVGMTFGDSSAPTVASVPDFIDWTERLTTLELLSASKRTSLVLTGSGEPERLKAHSASPNLFAVLGVSPRVGRSFVQEEHRTNSERVVILSHELWQRRWGGDRSLLGQSINAETTSSAIGSGSFRVVGILPQGFQGPRVLGLHDVDVWLPLPIDEAVRQSNRTHYGLVVLGHLREDLTIDAAHREMEAVSQRRIQDYPECSKFGDTVLRVAVGSLLDRTVGETRADLWMLLGAAGLILLISCANAANLVLARAAERGREIALRVSLGAKRTRIARQLLCESLVLAAAGGFAGFGTAVGLTRAFAALAPSDFPRLTEIGIDLTVLSFATGLTLATGLVFGLAPAVLSSKTSLSSTLKDGGTRQSAGRERSRFRNMLVVLETSLAMVLVIGAGLLINSYSRLGKVDPGFSSDGVLTTQIGLGSSYADRMDRASFSRNLLAEVRNTPGVEAASVIVDLPIGGTSWAPPVRLAEEPDSEGWMSTLHTVGTGYFETMGIRLLQGRTFTHHDTLDQPPVVILNQTMAEELWPRQNPLGRKITISNNPEDPQLTIVGVVNDIHQLGLDRPPIREFYMPYAQKPWIGWIYLVVRSSSSAAVLTGPIRGALRAVDPGIPFSGVETMDERVFASLSEQRTRTFLLVVFALVALTLAIGGLYGTMLYLVAQRTQEIGIRIALGAQGSSVIRMIAGDGMALVAGGMAIGTLAAVLVSKVLTSMVFGIEVIDPSTYASAVVLLAAVGFGACIVPARRATRTDLATVLRGD